MCCKALDLKAASFVMPRISAWREFQRTAPACVTNLVECAEAAAGTISMLLLPPRVLRDERGRKKFQTIYFLKDLDNAIICYQAEQVKLNGSAQGRDMYTLKQRNSGVHGGTLHTARSARLKSLSRGSSW